MTHRSDERRSTGHSPFVRRGPEPPLVREPELILVPGQCCPRPHCGGLVIERGVLTPEGFLREAYCTACARSSSPRLEAPRPPARLRLSEACEAKLARLCTERGRNRASEGFDDTTDISMPRSALDAATLYTMFAPESLLDGHTETD